jgi:flagellar basal body rod protein FlgB
MPATQQCGILTSKDCAGKISQCKARRTKAKDAYTEVRNRAEDASNTAMRNFDKQGDRNVRPTFLSFQTAARALAASQASLDVAGNNISNANTEGYTRQRLDLNAIASSGYTERYSSSLNFVDSGVEVAGISQIRDPFLDARYRRENSENGKYNTILSGLSDIENILDEASTDGLLNELNNFVSQLQALARESTSQDLALVTRTAAQKITEILNVYSIRIEEVRAQQINDLTSVVINKDLNSIVKNIASLNKQIRSKRSTETNRMIFMTPGTSFWMSFPILQTSELRSLPKRSLRTRPSTG